MDIIRQILLNVEDGKYPYGAQVYLEEVPGDVCAHHVALVFDAGLAEGRLIKTDAHGIVGASIDRLTSAGHDFCDGIRPDTMWNKAKEHVLKPGGRYGLSVLVEWVKLEVRRQILGAPPGS